jgi:ATP-dependent Clp protease, protease subunit
MAIPREKTDWGQELEYGIDLKNRRIRFGWAISASVEADGINDVSEASVEIAIRAIHRMQLDHPKQPIEIYMNSCGGDPYSMAYLVDVILASTCQFKFFGGGRIMSSATWIMAVCDERYLYPNARVMVHDGTEDIKGVLGDVLSDADEAKRFMDILYDIYAKNSRMPKQFWKSICARNLYLTAQEAIQLGLADFIVEPQKRGNLRKKRNHQLSQPVSGRAMRTLVNKLFKRVDLDIKQEIEIKNPDLDVEDPNITVDLPIFQPEQEQPVDTLTDQAVSDDNEEVK